MRTTSSLLIASGLLSATLLMGAELSYYEESNPTTMNPLFARSMVDRRTHELVFDRLYYRSAVTAEIKSRLVESDEVLGDGTKLKMVFKKGIKWHDETEVKASDLCFTLGAMLDPATPSQDSKKMRGMIVNCEADDASRTATVTFNKRYYNPKERLSVHLLPSHVFGGNTAIRPDHEFSSRPIGTGSMKGAKGRKGVSLNAMGNAHHNAKVAKVSQQDGGDPIVQVKTIIGGGVHGIVSVSPSLRSDIMATDDVALKGYDLRSWWFVAVNTQSGYLADKKVRQALNLSIDREELRQLTMGYDPEDIEQPCQFISGPFVPSSPYYNRSVRPETRADLNTARNLMTEAGVPNEAGMWVDGGDNLTLRIGMNAPLDLEARDLLNQLGNQLQSAGFGREVYRISANDWSSKAVTGKLSGEYDLLIGKWSFGVVEDVAPLFETRGGGRGSLNIFGYSNATVDQHVKEYDEAKTDTAARDAYYAMHKVLADELPYLFLWKLDTKSAWRTDVKNNTITPYFYFTEFDGWTL